MAKLLLECDQVEIGFNTFSLNNSKLLLARLLKENTDLVVTEIISFQAKKGKRETSHNIRTSCVLFLFLLSILKSELKLVLNLSLKFYFSELI